MSVSANWQLIKLSVNRAAVGWFISVAIVTRRRGFGNSGGSRGSVECGSTGGGGLIQQNVCYCFYKKETRNWYFQLNISSHDFYE